MHFRLFYEVVASLGAAFCTILVHMNELTSIIKAFNEISIRVTSKTISLNYLTKKRKLVLLVAKYN